MIDSKISRDLLSSAGSSSLYGVVSIDRAATPIIFYAIIEREKSAWADRDLLLF